MGRCCCGTKMERVVVDTSEAVKWFSAEEDTDKALQQLDFDAANLK